MGWKDTIQDDDQATGWRSTIKDEPGLIDRAKEFGESTIENLPSLGAMGGDMIAGPVGAGVGGYIGQSGKNLINSFYDPEKAPKNAMDYITEPLEVGAESVLASKAGSLIGKGIGPAINLLKGTGKRSMTLLGPSLEAVEARLAGRAQDGAKGYTELADQMGSDARNLVKETSKLDKKAAAVLSGKRNIGRKSLTAPIEKAMSELTKVMDGNAIGENDKKILSLLEGFKTDLNQLKPQVSEQQIKNFVEKLDKNIDWSDQSRNQLNNILKGLRKEIDYNLKVGNPEFKMPGNMLYGGLMKPVSQRAKVLESIQKRFNLKQEPNLGLDATDTTASKIKTSTGELKGKTKQSLKALKMLTGNDYQALAKDYELSKHFNRAAPGGARRTALGTALGYWLGKGNLATMAAGTSLGAAADIYGGQWAGKIIDTYRKAGSSQVFGKFAGAIDKAIERGPKALEVLGSILGADPEFRKRLEMSE